MSWGASALKRTSIDSLSAAVELEDALTYDEPPPWHAPVRQTLGAALLDELRQHGGCTPSEQQARRHEQSDHHAAHTDASRSAYPTIGVDPAAFEAFVKKIQTFGELTLLTINKYHKTNEYRDLQAKRQALEMTREALDIILLTKGLGFMRIGNVLRIAPPMLIDATDID